MSNQPIKNQQYVFYITLVSRATGQWQVNPTIAAGDFKVSTDGGAYNNLGTLPSVDPAGSRSVKVTLSASEMNGSNVEFQGVDAAGAEWDDVFINIQPLSWLNTDDVVRADLKQIDEQATTGNNATLNLKKLDIRNVGSNHAVYLQAGLLGGSGLAIVSFNDYGVYVEAAGSEAVRLVTDTGGSISAPQGIVGDIVGNITGTLVGDVYGNVTGSVLRVLEPVGISTGTFINAIADQVWDEQISEHLSAGSMGNKLNSASAAGDPWNTALPGAYGAGTAGNILGNNLDTTVSSRSSHSAADVWAVGSRTLTSFGTLVADIWSYVTRTLTAFGFNVTVGTNNDKTGYSLTADYDPAKTAAQVSDIPTANENADAFLKRDWTAVTGEAARSVLNALRKIRNKVSFNGVNTLTVTKEDDTTVAYTQPVVEDASQDPFKEVG